MLVKIIKRRYLLLGAATLVLAACASAVSSESTTLPEPKAEIPATNQTDVEPMNEPTSESVNPDTGNDPFEGVRLRFNPAYWPDTDFTKHNVDYSEFLSGGPPPDGIPAIDNPNFEHVDAADDWLQDEWPVMFFEWNSDARAYPLTILIYHEIVNDVVGEVPVALTFCPLCNATIAFDRTLPDGTLLDFGTTGNLRNSDLVMYDRQTKSWWQQFTGEAIVGELTGTQLKLLPSQIISWQDFKTRYPDGSVLSRETGHLRAYGSNPYGGYDNINSNPFLFDGELDGRLPAVERVVALQVEGIDVAYPFSVLREALVVNDEIAGIPLVVFWKEGTSSTFGASTEDVGSTGVYLRQIGDEILTFISVEDGFRDKQTGSLWNIFGEAVEGSLAGEKLERIVAGEHFWFAWAAFKPDTIVWSLER
jgi:hypothetical protein